MNIHICPTKPWIIKWKHDTHKIKRDENGRIIGPVTVPFEDYYEAVQMVNDFHEIKKQNEELLEALKGVLHHNNGLKDAYQLSDSLIRHIEQVLEKAEGRG